MELDTGVRTYELPGGVLRFNPLDPALYMRLEQLEERLKNIPTDDPDTFDRQAKSVLNWIFGGCNDVDKALGGVSLLARAANGKSVFTNFLEAFAPVFQEGIEQCAANI